MQAPCRSHDPLKRVHASARVLSLLSRAYLACYSNDFIYHLAIDYTTHTAQCHLTAARWQMLVYINPRLKDRLTSRANAHEAPQCMTNGPSEREAELDRYLSTVHA